MRYSTDVNAGYYHIDSVEGWWNSGSEGQGGEANLGYKTRLKGGYFPVEPYDHYSDLRAEMVKHLEACGLQSSGRTTRSARPVRRRSTTASTPCSRPPTTS